MELLLVTAGAAMVGIAALSKGKPQRPREKKVQFSQQAIDGTTENYLPDIQPTYINPDYDPSRNIPLKPKQALTGEFEDSFQSIVSDDPKYVTNLFNPLGMTPNQNRRNGTNYIEALTPFEFKPPKMERPMEWARGEQFYPQNNVHGNQNFTTLVGEKYATWSSKANSSQGALNDVSLWDMKGMGGEDPETGGWRGTMMAERKFEGYHPRTRIYPYSERFISTKPVIHSRPGIPYAGIAADYRVPLGIYEPPDNLDVTEYTREPLPTGYDAGDFPVHIGNVDLRGTKRKTCIEEDAGGINHLISDKTSQIIQYYVDFPGAEVTKVTPEIRMEIDPTIIQGYLANPYTPPITNMPNEVNLMPAYAIG